MVVFSILGIRTKTPPLLFLCSKNSSFWFTSAWNKNRNRSLGREKAVSTHFVICWAEVKNRNKLQLKILRLFSFGFQLWTDCNQRLNAAAVFALAKPVFVLIHTTNHSFCWTFLLISDNSNCVLGKILTFPRQISWITVPEGFVQPSRGADKHQTKAPNPRFWSRVLQNMTIFFQYSSLCNLWILTKSCPQTILMIRTFWR